MTHKRQPHPVKKVATRRSSDCILIEQLRLIHPGLLLIFQMVFAKKMQVQFKNLWCPTFVFILDWFSCMIFKVRDIKLHLLPEMIVNLLQLNSLILRKTQLIDFVRFLTMDHKKDRSFYKISIIFLMRSWLSLAVKLI